MEYVEHPRGSPQYYMQLSTLKREASEYEQTLSLHLKHCKENGASAFDDFGSFVDEEVKRTLAQKNLFISAGSSEEQSLNSPGQSSINFEKGTPTRARRGGNIDENPRFGELAVMLGNLTNQKAAADAGWAGWTTSGEFVRRDLSDILDKAGALALERKRYQDKMEKFLTLKAATKTDTLVRKAKKREDWKRDLNANEVDVESDLRIFSLGREQQVLKPLSKALSTLLQTIERQYEMIMPFKNKIMALEEHTRRCNEEAEFAKSEVRKQKQQALKEVVVKRRNSLALRQGLEQGKGPATARDLVNRGGGGAGVSAAEMEGVLYIPSPNFARGWATVKNGKLLFQMAGAKDLSVDLTLSTIKEKRDIKLRFVFAVITPQKTHLFQAETVTQMNAWMNVIQNSIRQALEQNTETRAGQRRSESVVVAQQTKHDKIKEQFQVLSKVEGNDACADCGGPRPEWLSINLGAMICDQCSGFHRNLGVHITKVRSATLDALTPSLLNFMASMGNARVNAIWEAELPQGAKPGQAATREQGLEFSKSKYERKQYVRAPAGGQQLLDQLLFKAVVDDDVQALCQALAWGARPNWKNDEEETRTAVHQAVCFGRPLCLEVMIQNGAGVLMTEMRGWTPLHYAAYHDDVEMASILLSRGSPTLPLATDVDGNTPLLISQWYYKDGAKLDTILGTADAKAQEAQKKKLAEQGGAI